MRVRYKLRHMSQSDPQPYFGYYTVDLFDCPPFEMFSNGDDPCAIYVLHFKKFEPHSMRVWCQLARTATRILDIGANVGVYALAAASLRSDIPIFAFEPNPHGYARVRVNKMKNGFKNICEVNAAIGHEDAMVDFAWLARPNG